MNYKKTSICILLVLSIVLGIGSLVMAEEVKIKFFSNLPDRTAGQGKLEQLLIDNFVAENPEVKVEVEALQDEPYKQKFKAYVAGNQLADIYMVWGQPAFFDPVMKGGYAAELNPKDYEDYNFFPGALNGFSYDGKLYGLTRNTDLMALYYNKALFEENNIKVPTTYEELLAAAEAFNKIGISPCAINGRDRWIISILYQDLVLKLGGDQDLIYDAVKQKIKFAENEILLEAAEKLMELVDAGFFQQSFIMADYGAARNLFAQERAAMYYMGTWEVGLATDQNLTESFRKNVSATQFPVIKDGKGKATDYVAWNGGGYAIASNSPVKEKAIELLNYMMRPESWAKKAWQMGLVIPGQKYSQFMTGNENHLQKELTDIISVATSFSGVTWQDSATPAFKTETENLSQELAAGVKTPEEFLAACDKAAQKALGN